MVWQDLVFLVGSTFSMFALYPTLRSRAASIPFGTSAPSACLGLIYGSTFFTLGMTFSAIGALVAGSMWTLIALFRRPDAPDVESETTSNSTPA